MFFSDIAIYLLSIKYLISRNVIKIWKSAFVVISHVHSTIKHYIFMANRDQNTTSANILTSTKWYYSNIWHFLNIFVVVDSCYNRKDIPDSKVERWSLFESSLISKFSDFIKQTFKNVRSALKFVFSTSLLYSNVIFENVSSALRKY